MKKLTTLIILLSLTNVFAQRKEKNVSPIVESNDNLTIYKNALKYNDIQSAIYATQSIIAREGENSTFKDTLAILYYNSNNLVSCHLLCKELLVKKPSDKVLLELNAISLSSVGSALDAIGAYEALFSATKNRFHGYQLAKLQFGVKRLAEAMVTLNYCLAQTETLKATVPFDIKDNQKQDVPLDAAIHNLKGLVSYELKDSPTAIKSFEEAIKIFPDFETAQSNKQSLELIEKK